MNRRNTSNNTVRVPNKANQHGSLKALRQKRATLLTLSCLRRYALSNT